MQNAKYNGTPILSPISRTAKRLENTSMTNLLTPSRSNKSILSSTRITPSRTTPRYSLSKPIDSTSPRNPLTSTHFNSNSSFYTPSKVNKSPPVESSIRECTPTHQAKYGRAGLFPVVHFFQKKVPVITAKQNSCVIKLSSNGPGLFDDTLDSAYNESQNVVNTSPAVEPSTRSVLDALKEISRKRIHGGDNYDKEKDKSNEYSKRNREEDTSLSPKSGTTSPQQAPKRICVVDPIYASNTSSFCLKNNKRKLYECWLPTNETKNKKVMSVETQTQTTDETITSRTPKTKSVAVQNESFDDLQQKSSEKSSSNSNSAEAKKTTDETNDDDDSGETIASAQRAWDEKIYAIQKKNKLAIVLSRITGEEPKLIPVPRLWDKTTNDVTDSTNVKSNLTSSAELTGITATSSGSALGLMLNGGFKQTTNTNDDKKTSEEATASNTTTSGISFGFGKSPASPAVTTTTTSVMGPIPAPSLSKVENFSTAIVTVVAPVTPKESASSLNSSSSVSSLAGLTTPSTTNFTFGTLKSPIVSAMSISTSITSSTSVSSSFGSGLSQVNTSTAANVKDTEKTLQSPPAYQFGATSTTTTSTLKPPASTITTGPKSISTYPSAFCHPDSSSRTSGDALPPNPTPLSLSSTANMFASPTLKTSAFSVPPTSKPLFGTTANGGIPSLGAASSPNQPIVFGANATSAFGSPNSNAGGNSTSSKMEPVSFATAFGLKPTTAGDASSTATLSAPKSISFDTGDSSNSASATSGIGGFSFKPAENAIASVGASGGSIFGAAVTATSTSGGFSSSIFGANVGGGVGNEKPVFGASSGTTAVTTAGFGLSATTTATAPSTVGIATKTFSFGAATTAASTAPPTFGSITSGTPTFGSSAGSSVGFGATTTTTSNNSSFGNFAASPPRFGSATSTEPISFGAAASAKPILSAAPISAANTSITGNSSGSGGFSFGASSNNLPPPSYAASVGANAVVTTTSTFGSTANSSFTFGSGSGTTGTGTSGFGSAASAAPTFGAAPPIFGASGGASNPPAFGAPAAATTTATPVFGFGGSGNTKPASTFGTGTASSGFGFSGGNNATTAAPPTFGSGAATVGGSGGGFNFGSNSSTPTTNAFSFGAATPATTTTPSFGASTAFGASTFGTPATTQAAGFGSAPNVNPFGKSTTSAFGAPAPTATVTPTFGASTTATPPTFGATPSATPTFGAVSPQTNNTSFGSAFGQQPATQTNFNSTFGASVPPSNNSTFAFGASSNTSSGFGSAASTQSPFGASAPSPSSGFNFKPPSGVGAADAGASKPVFAFGNSEPPKPASGGFNFSAGAASPPVPTPNFGAAFGAATPQQPGMFSIGSGATSKRVQLRAKRRT